MKKKCVILVPYYQKSLSPDERLSLNTLLKVNKDMDLDILFISPPSINPPGKVVYFPEEFFQSIHTYSKLLLNYKFWITFKDYEYALIYQLDCLIFRSNIEEWCNLGYHYIGAPFIEGFRDEGDKFMGVGNGGFSLRSIPKILEIFQYTGVAGEISYQGHEDVFYSLEIPRVLPFLKYKVAPIEIAKYFSWETGLPLLNRICHNKKPVGCHAFSKRDKALFLKMLGD